MSKPRHSPAQRAASDAFKQSILDDLQGFGDRWPDHCRFLAIDSASTPSEALDGIRKGHSVVLVGANGNTLCLRPAPANPVERLLLRLVMRVKVDVIESGEDSRIRMRISEGSLVSPEVSLGAFGDQRR